MTVLDAILQVLNENQEGLTCKELTKEIIEKNLYTFNTEHPETIVTHELRKHLQGNEFPTASPLKYFEAKNNKTGLKYSLLKTNSNPPEKQRHEISVEIANKDRLPSEQMADLYQQYINQLQDQLLEKIMSNSPAFFEQLVVKLMLSLGYGYDLQSGQVVGKSHDGGIDGFIDTDLLGLEKIYIQAKRYAPGTSVGRPEVQKFAGAMIGGVNKGVFITTSSFTKSAREYVILQNDKSISLIDGKTLTDLMIKKNIGVQVVHTWEICEIDNDFFC